MDHVYNNGPESYNIAIGYNALYDITTGCNNIAIGGFIDNPPRPPIGTIYFDSYSNNCMIMTGNGFVPITEDSEVMIKYKYFKYVDWLYVNDRVQEAKKLGFLFLDTRLADNNPIKIKYFEWCHRANLPFLIAYVSYDAYKLELHLNPRRVVVGRVFNEDAHDHMLELFRVYSKFNTSTSYRGDSYKIDNLSLEETMEMLKDIVILFRDERNLDMDY